MTRRSNSKRSPGTSSTPSVDSSLLKPLPLRVSIGEHETAISVLSRLAIRNGYTSVNDLICHVPNLPLRTLYAMEQYVEIAAALNDVCPRRLAEHSPVRVGSVLRFGDRTVLSGRGAVQGRVCLDCLEDDVTGRPGDIEIRPYLRDWWQVAHISSCPWHLTRLIGICPECNEHLNMRRARVAFCSCGHDLRTGLRERDAAETAMADRYLLGRLGRAPPESVELLDPLSFDDASGMMLAVGVAATDGLRPGRSWNPGSDRGLLASRGLRILRRGWPAFDDLLSKVLGGASRRAQSLGPYGYLQRWLTIESAKELEPFRARILKHAAEHRAFTPCRPMLRAQLAETKWITMLSAQRIVGRSAGLLHKALIELDMTDHATGSCREAAITRQATERLVAFFGDALIAPEARKYLGLSREGLDILRNQGLLSPCLSNQETSGAFYRISDLDHLAALLYGSASVVEEAPSDMISMPRANRLLRLGMCASLKALGGGQLRAGVVVRDPTSRWHLNGLHIAKCDVLQLLASSRGGVTRGELAKALSTHRLAIGKLRVSLGYRWPRGIVPIEDARSLQHLLVSAAEISRMYPGLGSPAAVAATLVKGSIRPVVREPGGPEVYFRREAEALVGELPVTPAFTRHQQGH